VPSAQETLSGRLVVAVLSFEDQTGDPNAAHWSDGASGLPARQIGCVKVLRLSSDQAIRYALEKNGLDRGAAMDATQAGSVGECIEAQRVIWGQVRRDKEAWRVGLRVLNVATGKVSPEVEARGTDWFAITDTLANATLRHLQIDPNTAENARMRRRFTASAGALEGFVKALWLETKGRPYSEQEDCLHRAAEADPNSAAIRRSPGCDTLESWAGR
jgi:TolB-like protein